LPKCTVDSDSCATFQKNLKQLRKKYHRVDQDLADAVVAIEADYASACNAFCMPMPGFPEYQRRVYKYDWRSTDIGKHPRECFRLVGVFLDAPSTSPKLTLLLAYYKGDRANVIPKDVAAEIKALKASLEQEDGIGAN
jgi:hypothetical protein